MIDFQLKNITGDTYGFWIENQDPWILTRWSHRRIKVIRREGVNFVFYSTDGGPTISRTENGNFAIHLWGDNSDLHTRVTNIKLTPDEVALLEDAFTEIKKFLLIEQVRCEVLSSKKEKPVNHVKLTIKIKTEIQLTEVEAYRLRKAFKWFQEYCTLKAEKMKKGENDA